MLGFFLRVVPLWLWGFRGCSRDECSYKVLARRIMDGEGLTPHEHWLWAPGYPYLLAAFGHFDSVYRVKRLQVALGLATAVLVYLLAKRVLGRSAGRWAVFLMALHPTLAFYTGTLWSETVYAFLLTGAAVAMLWAREGQGSRALVPGALLGLCVLFRGVATYMAPIFAIALLWPGPGSWREALRARWRHVAILLATVALVVAPYSRSASEQYGGFIVSDASLGQVMYVGNNDFPLTTYEYGNGVLSNRTWTFYYAKGRPHCDHDLSAAEWNRCEVRNGVAWIRDNPGRFLARIPQRLAQLLNPNTFLTRHMRTGKWLGMPWWLKEGLSVLVVLFSLLVVLGGTVGAWARARGAYGALAVGIVVYHLVVVSSLFGLSRFRAPLEPLWIVFLAGLLADPRGTWEALREAPARAVGATLALAALVPLMLWYLSAGFPMLYG
ncbi:MAG: glycosyltransferase family 39 protein [Deltaproteobacteria bacterium]|nr:glycosyltransferase family 39 protein [Deltaproteobacteria bacterium]MBW2255976.1 glycosyltransferase family 39 protein [Deltaproteobacteria bacterium]